MAGFSTYQEERNNQSTKLHCCECQQMKDGLYVILSDECKLWSDRKDSKSEYTKKRRIKIGHYRPWSGLDTEKWRATPNAFPRSIPDFISSNKSYKHCIQREVPQFTGIHRETPLLYQKKKNWSAHTVFLLPTSSDQQNLTRTEDKLNREEKASDFLLPKPLYYLELPTKLGQTCSKSTSVFSTLQNQQKPTPKFNTTPLSHNTSKNWSQTTQNTLKNPTFPTKKPHTYTRTRRRQKN